MDILSLMDICSRVIVKNKLLYQVLDNVDDVHVQLFKSIKKALWNRKNCYNGIKRQFSTSYKLPYVFQSPGSSPPSELLMQVGLGVDVGQLIEKNKQSNESVQSHSDWDMEQDLDEISSDELYNNYFSDEQFDDL